MSRRDEVITYNGSFQTRAMVTACMYAHLLS